MASKDELDTAVNALEKEATACRNKKLPARYSEVISSIQQEAATLAQETAGPPSSSSVARDDIDTFRDLLDKATKKLRKLRRDPRSNPDAMKLEGLQKSLKDLQSFHFQLRKGDGGLTVSGIFTNSDAKAFWSESFGNKVRN